MRAFIQANAFVLGLLCAGAACAQSAEPPAPASEAPSAAPAPNALSANEMADASGGQGVAVEVLTQQQLNGTTTGNTVTAGTLTTGEVNFGPGALDGFSGVGNFVINTGANNTLQGSINLSIVTTPAS